MRKGKDKQKNTEQTTTTDATVNTLAGTTESNVESTNTETTTEEQATVEEEPTPDITTDLVKENPYRYAGYYFDRKTQNYYLHARYYNPRIGRFISLDQLNGKITNPLSLNRYVYGLNNPVNYTDPTGNYNAAVFEVVKEIEGKYKNNPIELAQAYLVQMGYDIGPEGIDGDNSGYAETWRAIKQFQENSGLPGTGDIDGFDDPTLGKMKEVVLNWDKYKDVYAYNPDLEFEEANSSNYLSEIDSKTYENVNQEDGFWHKTGVIFSGFWDAGAVDDLTGGLIPYILDKNFDYEVRDPSKYRKMNWNMSLGKYLAMYSLVPLASKRLPLVLK